jgi:tetratricopeptide (TPR) repeat protein
MFMRLAAALTGLAGLALSLAALALTVPTPAAAGGIEDDWKACVAPGTAPAERITRCDAAIADGTLKPAPLAQALTGRGFARASQKDFNAAIADFDAALNQHSDPTAFYYRGLALDQIKEADRALADFDRAIALNPKNGAYYRARSFNYSKRKDYQRAIADVTAALGVSTRPQVEYMLRGRLQEVAGEQDKAIADYQKVLEIDPDDEIVRNALGRLGGALPDSARLPPGACSANDISHEERIAGCTAVIESGQLTGWTLKTAYCNRGYALTELGQYDRVIADADAAIRLDDKLACAHLNRGRAWYYKHDLDRAIADYTQAVKSDGRFHEA